MQRQNFNTRRARKRPDYGTSPVPSRPLSRPVASLVPVYPRPRPVLRPGLSAVPVVSPLTRERRDGNAAAGRRTRKGPHALRRAARVGVSQSADQGCGSGSTWNTG
jgi:hypothetical protein